MRDDLGRELSLGDLVVLKSVGFSYASSFALAIGEDQFFLYNSYDEAHARFMTAHSSLPYRGERLWYPKDADALVQERYYKLCRDLSYRIYNIRKEWDLLESLRVGDIVGTNQDKGISMFLGNMDMIIYSMDDYKSSFGRKISGLCFIPLREVLKYNCLLKNNLVFRTDKIVNESYNNQKGLEVLSQADAFDTVLLKNLLLKEGDNKVYGVLPSGKIAPKISNYRINDIRLSSRVGHIEVTESPYDWSGCYKTAHGKFKITVEENCLITIEDYFREKGL